MLFHFAFHLFSCIDQSLGRIDRASLSTQTLMELFIDGITNKELICGSAEHPKDLSEWHSGITLNDSNEVTSIAMSYVWIEGSIELNWLPPTVERVVLPENYLTGSLDLTCLPDGCTFVDLSGNRFSGTIDLTALPNGMKRMDLSWSRLSGTLNLEHLPSSMEGLEISSNAFTGTISLVRLPQSLRELDVGGNKLSGNLNLTQLPPELRSPILCDNNFEGWTDFSQLPKALGFLTVENLPNVSGEISVAGRELSGVYTDGSGVRLVDVPEGV